MTGQQHPSALAELVLKTLGDADDSTARVALEIAKLLLAHRKVAEIEFLNEVSTSTPQEY